MGCSTSHDRAAIVDSDSSSASRSFKGDEIPSRHHYLANSDSSLLIGVSSSLAPPSAPPSRRSQDHRRVARHATTDQRAPSPSGIPQAEDEQASVNSIRTPLSSSGSLDQEPSPSTRRVLEARIVERALLRHGITSDVDQYAADRIDRRMTRDAEGRIHQWLRHVDPPPSRIPHPQLDPVSSTMMMLTVDAPLMPANDDEHAPLLLYTPVVVTFHQGSFAESQDQPGAMQVFNRSEMTVPGTVDDSLSGEEHT